MKRLLARLSILAFLWAGLEVMPAAESDGAQQVYKDRLENWREALSQESRILAHPYFYRTNQGPPKLIAAVRAIEQDRLGMAYFLCEKIATETIPNDRLYSNVLLLEELAGIDLLRARAKPAIEQDFGENMRVLVARFKREWKRGVYKNPASQIAELCVERRSRESGPSLVPADIVALRRYGIFGLPELVRQIKANNSKHAFAAYLIVTGQRVEFADYLKQSDRRYRASNQKLEHVARRIARMKEQGGGNTDVMKKVSAALSGKAEPR